MSGAPGSDRLVYSIEIDAAMEEVWRAITDPEWTRRYFHDTAIHSSWVVGEPVSYDMPDGTSAIGGTLTVFDPPRRFAMRARFNFDGIPADEGESIVTWEVAPRSSNGVTLTLVHDRVPPVTLSVVRDGWPGILLDLHRTLSPGGEGEVVQG